MKEKLYIKAVDALRVISILAVVLIHSTTKTLESSHYDLVNFQFAGRQKNYADKSDTARLTQKQQKNIMILVSISEF